MAHSLKEHHIRFLKYLTNLSSESNREELAVLRRGLSSPPAEDVSMYRFIARFVPDEDRNTVRERVYYLLASLYALHPVSVSQGNFGNHMSYAASQLPDRTSTERRFTVLLNSNLEDLPDYLRQAVSFIKSSSKNDIPINWFSLFEDLLQWNHPHRISQRNWANGFWGYQPGDHDKNEPSQTI